MKKKKITGKSFLFLITFLSFVSIIVFLIFFVLYAPGHYQGGTDITSMIIDKTFIILLIINLVSAILSFGICLKECYDLIRKKKIFSKKELWNILLGVYPICCILYIWNWDLSQYLRMLGM